VLGKETAQQRANDDGDDGVPHSLMTSRR